ncbi:unnamed protein product [Tuber aestivum]|uniref:Calcium uniporter protein n=1 Tax=Tuber aestivum TaxID=59557 RepID=A0A292Q0G1_9PEZI|nr:unnamed protein product [Tuber aestivum]
MNHRVLLRSPGFQPERQLLKSSTQSLTSHLARPPSLNFQKSFLFVASSPSGDGGRAFSPSSAGRFMDGGGGSAVERGGCGSEIRKGGVGKEGGEEGDCGEKGESGEDKAGGVSGDSGVGELAGSSSIGTSVLWHREGIDQSPPAKGSPGPSVITKGKLLPTSSRLLKLLLPLKLSGSSDSTDSPLALLVHPQQPLSYLECLIQAQLPLIISPNSAPRSPSISFKVVNVGDALPEGHINTRGKGNPQSRDGRECEGGAQAGGGPDSLNPFEKVGKDGYVRWPASTEVGDFVRDVARDEEFVVEIERSGDTPVSLPSFKQRTHYLRQRLATAMGETELQARLKSECDRIARRRAQKVAVAGFAGLAWWWAAVYWLTLEASLGWHVMEPVTHLVCLSTVVGGCLLFFYNNREALCPSVLHNAVSRRQKRLYREGGFDADKWEELVVEGKGLRREIGAIAEDYDVDWDEWSNEAGRG